MPKPKTAYRIEAERLCEKYPDATNLSLAKRIAKEFSISQEIARGSIRLVRGAYGKKRRHHATAPKPHGKAGQKPRMPPSLAEPWTPFVVEGCKRVGIISDVHIPYHDEQALEAAIEHLKKSAIDTLILNGDFCDFYRISRWQKDPRKRHFSEERKSIIAGLDWLRESFPKVRIIFKDGNHEERFAHFIWEKAPELYDLPGCQLPTLLEFDRIGIEHVTDQRPVMVGKLPLLHGHEMGRSGISSPVNPSRGVFLRTMHTVLVGHGHRTSTHVETDMFGREVAVWSIGCLAADNPEYQRIGKTNKGFAFAEVASDGTFNVNNLRVEKSGTVRTA
jgi:predicted phosphodiesterase